MERKMFIESADLQRLYEVESKTTGDIAARYGVSEATVRHWLKRYGIAIRSKAEAAKLAHQSGDRKRIENHATLKVELLCRGCGAVWVHTEGTTRAQCPYCGKSKDARVRSGEAKKSPNAKARKRAMTEWQKEHSKERAARHRTLLRKRVFFRITGSIVPRCARCGCDDPRLLEINHKNGGGSVEVGKGTYTNRFYYDIAAGKRGVEDLELLCRPCNALHYLEMKYGPLPMKVVWLGSPTPPSTEQTV